MKALYRPFAVAAAVFLAVAVPLAAPSTAWASGYLSSYYGGGSYLSSYSSGGLSRVLNAYSSGGYSGGYGYSVANYGYSSGNRGADTPHRSTWRQYTRVNAEYTARAYAIPPCGAYDRNPLGCRQATTRWNPLTNQ